MTRGLILLALIAIFMLVQFSVQQQQATAPVVAGAPANTLTNPPKAEEGGNNGGVRPDVPPRPHARKIRRKRRGGQNVMVFIPLTTVRRRPGSVLNVDTLASVQNIRRRPGSVLSVDTLASVQNIRRRPSTLSNVLKVRRPMTLAVVENIRTRPGTLSVPNTLLRTRAMY